MTIFSGRLRLRLRVLREQGGIRNIALQLDYAIDVCSKLSIRRDAIVNTIFFSSPDA
jgi:hypothetical protein